MTKIGRDAGTGQFTSVKSALLNNLGAIVQDLRRKADPNVKLVALADEIEELAQRTDWKGPDDMEPPPWAKIAWRDAMVREALLYCAKLARRRAEVK